MGWKSTITMPRRLMESRVRDIVEDLTRLTDAELSDLLELLSGGDSHGHNYAVGEPSDFDRRLLELLGER